MMNSVVALQDPLRELVLISDDSSQQTKALSLAREAANTLAVDEIRVDSKFTPKKTVPIPTISVEKNIVTLSAVFQDPKDAVDPEKEREFMDKLHAIEESDSEGLHNDRPVLGKVSLTRRAKFAVTQAMIEEAYEKSHPIMNVNLNDASVKASEPLTEDDEAPTLEEVRRHMNMFHLRRGIPPASTKLVETSTGKYSAIRRPKTARNNK